MSGQCECRSKFGESCAFCKGSEEEYPWALDPMLAIERAESEYARGNEPDCDCSKCGCSLESDAYARGKAYGMAEAIKWLRERSKLDGGTEFESEIIGNIADALERGEHRDDKNRR